MTSGSDGVCHDSGPVSEGYLQAAGGQSALAGCLSGQLLRRLFATSGLSCSWLGVGHDLSYQIYRSVLFTGPGVMQLVLRFFLWSNVTGFLLKLNNYALQCSPFINFGHKTKFLLLVFFFFFLS